MRGGGNQDQERTLYDVLGVSPESTAAEIKRAYRERALEVHPDTAQGPKPNTQAFIEVSEAFETLNNPGARATYDRSIGNVASVGATSAVRSSGARVGSAPMHVKTSAFTEGVSSVEMQQRYRRRIFVPRNEEERRRRMDARRRTAKSARSSFGLLVILPLCIVSWGYSRVRSEF